MIHTNIYEVRREREREKTRKSNCLHLAGSNHFPLCFFVSTICLDICSKVSPRKGGLVGVRIKQVVSNWMLCKDLQTWSQQKPLHLLYIDFSNIWFIHQHPTNPSKIVPFRIHSIGPSFCDILESWFEAALGFEPFPAKNGGWPCGEVTNVHDRARGYRVLRVKCGFSVNLPCQSGDLFCYVYI